ncbi:MAG: type VI secretion system baseplate subunit TssK [Phycisphaerales bacterium]|nr:MAG: type VI secretion system baseplate subunit TssK [Phycisphaerales bacterium]
MRFWTETHWSEGMFLRPHHLQAAQRWFDTVVAAGYDALRPFAWGFVEMRIAPEPLENFTLRLDECTLRLKDGTWVNIPENTEIAPLNFEKELAAAGGSIRLFFGIPRRQEVRANSVPLERPDLVDGNPRYEPHALMRRDENTGKNPQMVYVRRIRGRLFTQDADMTGFDVVPVCTVRRSDRPGATPEIDVLGAGPLLALQAHAGLSSMVKSLADQVEAKDEVLAREARDHRMRFTDGVAASTEHLLKLHVLNETRAHLRALLQSPLVHPFDAYQVLARLVGHLSIFSDDLTPGALPDYDHDRPAETFDQLRRRILVLLESMRPMAYVERRFTRVKDARGKEGLAVELDRGWIDDNLDMYVGLQSTEMDVQELERFIYGKLNLKLASPSRAPRIYNLAVAGLRLEIKAAPAGTLPRRDGLHYFRINKTIGPDRTGYWRECEQERGIRISIQEGQLDTFDAFAPTLYVIQRERP